jgi:dihydrofolate reductase
MNLIFACDENYGIGINNRLPDWKLKGDLRKFSKLTTGKGNNVVIMGKNTYISLPNNYLKNRLNLVVSETLYNEYNTHQTEYIIDDNTIMYTIHNNTIIFKNLVDAYTYGVNYINNTRQNAKNKEDINLGEIWVIGGSSIYEMTVQLNLVNKIYVTHVNKNYNCDTFLGNNTIDFLKTKTTTHEEKLSYNGNDEHEVCIYYNK